MLLLLRKYAVAADDMVGDVFNDDLMCTPPSKLRRMTNHLDDHWPDNQLGLTEHRKKDDFYSSPFVS